MTASVQPLPAAPRRRPTATSAFGVGRRESHDAGAFYARFTPPLVSEDSELRQPRHVDALWCHDASDMDPYVEDASVALVVTSPPYFAGKAYEQALGEGHIPADYGDYLAMLYRVFEQCRHKLEPGGRIAVNVANLGRKPYRSLAGDVTDILERLGFLLRGEIVWRKSQGASGSCAWGTYQRPGNPVLRDLTERVVLASKGRFDRALTPEERRAGGWPHEASMTMDDFMDATTDVWDIPAESASRVGHPAPFPVALPQRLIELYTYRGDLVLDPFMGAGTTAVAALRTERHYAGFDTDATYVALAEARVTAERERLALAPPARRLVVPDTAAAAQPAANPVTAALGRGEKAKEVARLVLEAAGFQDITADPTLRGTGISVTFQGRDHRGSLWLFHLSGSFSATKPGLQRVDTTWRVLGQAAVLHEARHREDRADLGPLVLLSTDLPKATSAAGRALAALTGPDRPVHQVVGLLEPDAAERLRRLAAGT